MNIPHVVNAQRGSTLQVVLSGYIDRMLVNELLTLIRRPDWQQLELLIDSEGGGLMEANTLYAMLSKDTRPKTAFILGRCMSAATIVALACEKIVMDSGALWMVHAPWTGIEGTSDDLRATADVLDKLAGEMATRYAQKTAKTTDEIQTLLQKDSYMTAQEALDYGFIDEIINYKPQADMPAAVAVAVQALKKAGATTETEVSYQWSAVLTALAANDLPLVDVPAYAQNLRNQCATLAQDKTTLATQLTQLQSEVQKLRAEADTAVLETAVANGKIKAEQVSIYTTALRADRDNTLAHLNALPVQRTYMSLSAMVANPQLAPTRSQWTFNDWLTNDRTALEALRTQNPNQYKALYKAEFGMEPNIE